MIYIETDSIDAAFHFATEEFLIQRYQPESSKPIMMIWQADKCVMLGAYQVAHAEVNMTYAKQAGISIVRRSSGGGAIYTDMGTLLYTIIQPYNEKADAKQIAQEKVAALIINALKKMGVPAVLEGRNDILVNGKKISGIAQQVRQECICTHGSLLYDTNLESLTQVLQVDEGKIQSKAIRSIRSRVTNINDYVGLSTTDFKIKLIQSLLDDNKANERKLTDSELAEIEKIKTEKYANPAWTYEKSPSFTFKNSKRFPAGKIEVYLDIKNGSVASCTIRGDFLGTIPIRELEKKLENTQYQHQPILNAIDGISLTPYIGEITKEEFLSCMF